MRIADAFQASGLPPLETEILMAVILNKERTWVLAHPEATLTDDEENLWKRWVQRRRSHEPLAYILGCREFYGRTFAVSPDVLIPRPATEGLVDAALAFLSGGTTGVTDIDTGIVAFVRRFRAGVPKFLVDVGTGSGCIAVTLVLETGLHCIATDTSDAALSIAEHNAETYGVTDRVTFRTGPFLMPLSNAEEPFFLVSNPPYIPEGEDLMPDVSAFEPRSALYAGKDGMDVLSVLARQAKAHPSCLGVALECRTEQVEKLKQIL